MKKFYPLATIALAIATARWISKETLRFRLRRRTIVITGGADLVSPWRESFCFKATAWLCSLVIARS